MKRRWSALAFALIALVCGCDRGDDFPVVRITGKVAIDGVAVAEGTIDFVPLGSGQGQSTTAPIVAGVYEADVAPGSVRVFFHATRETGRTVEMFDQPMPERENLIPPRYQQGLETEVSSQKTTHDFNLSADADENSNDNS